MCDQAGRVKSLRWHKFVLCRVTSEMGKTSFQVRTNLHTKEGFVDRKHTIGFATM